MSELPTDAIVRCIDWTADFTFADCIPEAHQQLAALLADRDMWRNRSLAIEECISDFGNRWQQARDYPSQHDEQGDTQ